MKLKKIIAVLVLLIFTSLSNAQQSLVYAHENADFKRAKELFTAKKYVAAQRKFKKVYDKIIAKGTDLTGIKKKLFFWAVDLGLKWKPYEENGWWYETQLGIARKLIFSKWQEALGGNLKAIASGSAALQPRLARVFNAAGCPVMEGYGLTETSPVVSVNDMRNKGFKIGTVGKLSEGGFEVSGCRSKSQGFPKSCVHMKQIKGLWWGAQRSTCTRRTHARSLALLFWCARSPRACLSARG